MSAPGGWASPEEINHVRAALRQRRTYLRSLAQGAEQRAEIIAKTPTHSIDHLAQTRGLGVRWREEVKVCEQALALFDGIAHGARIEALASPEEAVADALR